MDDILLIKAENLERYIQRIHQEYDGSEDEFLTNFTKQDAILLNLLRSCETAIDMGTRVIRLKSLGVPQSSREIFVLLEKSKIITPELSQQMQNMVGFRNIAVHNYTQIDLKIIKSIIQNDLKHLTQFSKILLSGKY